MFKNLIPWHHKREKQSNRGKFMAALSKRGLSPRQDNFDSLLDNFYKDVSTIWGEQWDVGLGCDVKDADKELVIRADAPGFEADEINVQLSGNRLVLQAEHKEESNGDTMRYGSFYRSLTVPRGIEADKIKARYKNGVLEVHLPKGQEALTKRIQVKAK